MGIEISHGNEKFWGLSGLLKSTGILCCGVCSKMDNSILNNVTRAGLLHMTAKLPSGRCAITLSLWKICPLRCGLSSKVFDHLFRITNNHTPYNTDASTTEFTANMTRWTSTSVSQCRAKKCQKIYECRKSTPNGIRYPFVNVSVLKLNESCTDRRNVALLAGECHSSGTFRIPQFRVSVNTSITDSAIETSHDQCQLHWSHDNHINAHATVQRCRLNHYSLKLDGIR